MIKRPAAVVLAAMLSPGAFAQCAPSFTSPVSYGVGGNPQSIAAGDFNGDGKLDLAVGNSGSNNVSVLLGIGNGTFQQAINFHAGVNGVFCIALGDLDRDGRVDLVVGGNSLSIAVLLGRGDGTFTPATFWLTGVDARSIVVGDINADGKADVVADGEVAGTLSVLYGNGDGTLAGLMAVPAGLNPYCIALGDFNSDGLLDVAVSNVDLTGAELGRVSLLLANADGSLRPPSVSATGGSAGFIGVGNFNQDNTPDIAVANGGSVSVLTNNGSGPFSVVSTYPISPSSFSIAVGDFNGDGMADVVAPDATGNRLRVLLGNGDGTFLAVLDYSVGATPLAVAISDFNGDGRPDFAAVNSASNSVSIRMNTTGPTILQAPSACQLYAIGQVIQLPVTATGPGPLVYQWFKNGVPLVDSANLTGSATPVLTIGSALAADSGTYTVRVSSPCFSQSATTAVVTVTVAGPSTCLPNIVQNPLDQRVLTGGAATFVVAASGGNLSYQWRRGGATLGNGGNIGGATTPTLTIIPAHLEDTGAAFDCVVTNACGSVRSDPAGLSVTASCPADFNHSGVIGAQDIFDFLAAYFTGCP